VKWGLVSRNAADAAEPPRPQKYYAKVWTPEQALRFWQQARTLEPRCWIAFVLAIMTGMRQAEILGLKWPDINWDNGTLSVQRTMNYVNCEPVFMDLKTDRSRRLIALSPETIESLKYHKSIQTQDKLLFGKAYQDNNMIVATKDGRPMSQNSLNKSWQRALEQINVPRIRFHDLRHTHASLLLALGVHPKVVQERLGHANINITLDTYSHLLPGLQKEAAHQFDSILFNTAKRNT
jgi:integrase